MVPAMSNMRKATEEGPGSEAPAFLPEGAFVVQFGRGPGGTTSDHAGRVEHVASGQAARFTSPDELLAFVRTILRQQGIPAGAVGNTDRI